MVNVCDPGGEEPQWVAGNGSGRISPGPKPSFRHDQYGGNLAARPAASANAGCAGSSADANGSATARDSTNAGCTATARDSTNAGCSTTARDSANASVSANAALAARARAGSPGQAAAAPFANRTRDGRVAR